MAQLKLNLLGTFAATRSGSPIHTFRSNTERALLVYLAVEAGQAHLRDSLAAMFWPESAEVAARRNFRVTLSRLRKAIGDTEAAQPVLLVTPQTLQCNPQAAIWSDVTAFNRWLDACDTHQHDHVETCEACYQRLEQAAALYQGDFLAGLSIPNSLPFEEWARVQREILHRRALQSFDTLACTCERRGDYAGMGRFAQRQLAQEPWREGAQRQLMRTLALTGQRGAALKQYEICRQLLKEEFGVEPAGETSTLYEEIRAGALGWEAAPGTPEPENPYKGLHAFGEADAADFFGRGALVERLLARVTPSPESGEDQGGGRFLAIVGPSGSGKSSLAYAGLIPALRRGTLPGSEHWRIVQMLPGARPFKALLAAIAIEFNLVENCAERQRLLQEDALGLLRTAETVLPADKNVKLLLVIDQFEEMFTLTTDEAERERFLHSLLAAVAAPQNRLHIVITLHADFYDRPMMYADFGALIRRGDEAVLPLKAEELEQAITGPAARLGVHFEPGLAAAIAADVSTQPGVLPLLQYALTELFDRRENGVLTRAAYQASGGVSGVLVRRAEAVYAGLDDNGQAAACQVFLRLVTLGEGTEDVRRRVPRSELEALSLSAIRRKRGLSLSKAGLRQAQASFLTSR